MNTWTALLSLLHLSLITAFPFKNNFWKRSTEAKQIDCMAMESLPGDYTFTSDGGDNVCGFYLVADPDQLITVEFSDFDVSCDNGGLLAVVDGWELSGEFFPSPRDHELPMEERYNTFCGPRRPRTVFVASQNVALIQHRITTPGQKFTVRVKFADHPEPCNVLMMHNEGLYTIQNYGKARNCTMLAMSPENVRFLAVDVGVGPGSGHKRQEEEALSEQTCTKGTDFVQVLGSDTLSMTSRNNIEQVCGLHSMKLTGGIVNMCTSTAVRLVSSGNFHNSATFIFLPPTEKEVFAAGQNLC